MAGPRARQLWLATHRWVGLTLASLLITSAISGTLLTIVAPLDRWWHAELFRAGRLPAAAAHEAATTMQPGIASTAPLESIRQMLERRHGAQASFTLRPPREPDETLQAYIRSPDWDGTAFVEPASGELLGERGERDNVAGWLFELHSELSAGEAGVAILALLAASYVLMLLTGVLVWWPKRWRQALVLRLQGGVTVALRDTHRLAGVVLGLLVLVQVASGAYMAFRPLSSWITAASGRSTEPPGVPAPVGSPTARPQHRTAIDRAVELARERFPEGRVGYVSVPVEANRPIQVRLRLPDDPHPNGLTSVYVHPQCDRVLAAWRWNELDPGKRAFAVVYPLHSGTLGGASHKAVTALTGIALGWYAISGCWLWWRRRRRR